MTDQRISLRRADLAPCDDEGLAVSSVYAKLESAQCRAVVTSIRASPEHGSEQVSQILFGERFDILRREGGFAWGQGRRDGYVGWVETPPLSTDLVIPTHRVAAAQAAVLCRPEIRAPTTGMLGMNALVEIGTISGAFARVEGLGWVASAQLAPIGSDFADPVDVAMLFVGAPYIWGARNGAGLDCSGLVQQALFAAGRQCPRDADQQAALGVEVARDSLNAGDLIAWRGHIGMMIDAHRLIHANAHHMAVAIEPLETAVARIAESTTGHPTAYRRLDHGLSTPASAPRTPDPGLSTPSGRTLSPVVLQ